MFLLFLFDEKIISADYPLFLKESRHRRCNLGIRTTLCRSYLTHCAT